MGSLLNRTVNPFTVQGLYPSNSLLLLAGLHVNIMGKSVIYRRSGLISHEGLIFESRRAYTSHSQQAALWRVPAKAWGSVNDMAVRRLHSQTGVSAFLLGVHQRRKQYGLPLNDCMWVYLPLSIKNIMNL